MIQRMTTSLYWAECKELGKRDILVVWSMFSQLISTKGQRKLRFCSPITVAIGENQGYCHSEETVAKPLLSLICKVYLPIDEDSEIYNLRERDVTVISEFLQDLQPPNRPGPTPRLRSRSGESNEGVYGDGERRVDTVSTASGWQSRRVCYFY